jgi:hypothetical protein
MRRIVYPAVVAATAHAFLLAGYVAAYRGDLAALVCVGQERMGRVPYELIRVGFERFGYDGQFYYAIARGPWRRHLAGIDHPPGRQLRILYPAVSWLVSGGNGLLLLWAMPAVNLLAIAGLAAVGALLARRNGLNPWWGCLLPLAVDAGLPALRDLTDVLAVMSLGCLLAAWLLRAGWWPVSMAAAAAVFGREQNLAVVLLVLAAAAWQRQGKTCAGLSAVVLLWAGWVCCLRLMYGAWPFLPAEGNFGRPFAALLDCWPDFRQDGLNHRTLVQAGCLAFVVLQAAGATYLAGRPGDLVLRLFLLAGVALAVLAGTAIYVDKWSFMRVLSWLPLGLWLACVEGRRRWALAALALPVLLPVGVVVRAWAHA